MEADRSSVRAAGKRCGSWFEYWNRLQWKSRSRLTLAGCLELQVPPLLQPLLSSRQLRRVGLPLPSRQANPPFVTY